MERITLARIQDVMVGAMAGLLATIPMTGVMELLHRGLPGRERYPLPPRQVAVRAVHKINPRVHLREDEQHKITLVSHFGMGTAMGALYGALNRLLPVSGPVAGMGVGLGVWAGNYLGLLPMAGLLAPASKHPPRRTALMIGAHLVWGIAAGALLNVWDSSQRCQNAAPRRKPRPRRSSLNELRGSTPAGTRYTE